VSNQVNDTIVDNYLDDYDLISSSKYIPQSFKEQLRQAILSLDEELIDSVLAGIAHFDRSK
jgi:hypothetical protein